MSSFGLLIILPQFLPMKACVVGGGPSGIFLSRYLNDHGVSVNLFEKTGSLLGNYKYAKSKTDLTRNLVANVMLNSDEKTINDAKCDFYVVATGGKAKELDIDGKEHIIGAMDVISNYYDPAGSVTDTSKYEKAKQLLNCSNQDLCIIGIGNVALDLAYYLRKKAKSITILARGGLSNAPFDNYVMRDIVRDFNISIVDDNMADPSDRKTTRRFKLLQQKDSVVTRMIERIRTWIYRNPKPQLNLLFNASPYRVNPKQSQLEVAYLLGNAPKTGIFDAVISSIGFIPNPVEIKTSKPVYYSGWCVRPRGNIGDAMIDAKNTVAAIMSDIAS